MPVSILQLPPELLDRIVKEGNYASALALRYTCRELYWKIAPPKSTTKLRNAKRERRWGMADLLEIEKWPCYDFSGACEMHLRQPIATRDFFACCHCLRIRCASHFSNAMM